MRKLHCELHCSPSLYLGLNQLGIVQVPSARSEASFFFQACSNPELVQLVLNAQANSPPAEGAVKGIRDVQHHLQAVYNSCAVLSS